MSKKTTKKYNVDIIRCTFNEARSFLNAGNINVMEYRSLLSSLLLEVKNLEEKYNNEDILEHLGELINLDEEMSDNEED